MDMATPVDIITMGIVTIMTAIIVGMVNAGATAVVIMTVLMGAMTVGMMIALMDVIAAGMTNVDAVTKKTTIVVTITNVRDAKRYSSL